MPRVVSSALQQQNERWSTEVVLDEQMFDSTFAPIASCVASFLDAILQSSIPQMAPRPL